MRVGFLGPAGTFSEEALRGDDAGAGAEEVPFVSIHDTIAAVAAGRRRPRARADRERARGRGQRDARRAGLPTRPTSCSSASACCAIRDCLLARETLALEAIARRRLASPAAGPVRALPAHGAARRRAARGDVDRRGGPRGRRRRGEPWAALGPPRRGRALRRARPARGHRRRARQRDALRLARARRRARRSASPGPPGGRPRSSSPAPATRSPAGSCAACRSSPSAASTSPGSSRGPSARASGTTLFHVDLEGRAAEPRVADAIAGAPDALRGRPSARLLPRRRPGADADGGGPGRRLHFRRRSPMGSVTPPGHAGPRRSRAPAART